MHSKINYLKEFVSFYTEKIKFNEITKLNTLRHILEMT